MDALTELEAFMRTEFLCISVLRVALGPGVKLASCKSALNPPVVYSTDRSKTVVLVLFLLFVALWFPHCFLFFFSKCVVMLALWSPSSIVTDFVFCFTSCVVMLAVWSPSTAAHFAFCFTVVLRVSSGPSVKLADRESALTPSPNTHRWFILLTVLRRWSLC